MRVQTLPIMYTQSGQTFQVSTHTPLVEEISQLLDQGADLTSAVEQLMRASGMLKGEVTDALKARILGIPEVRSALEKLQGLGLIVEDAGEQHVALTRLGVADKSTKLELKASGGEDIAAGKAVIGLKGEAELALIATAHKPAAAAKLGLPIAASDVLHSCQLGGNVGLKATVKAPAVNAGIEAAADLNAKLGVTWHFQRHAEDTVLNSLVYAALDVGQGASPWDLEDVMRVLDEPRQANGHLDAMKAIDLRAERTLGFSAGISLQRGFSKAFEVAGAEGKQKIAAAAKIGASLRYAMRHTGHYELRLVKQGGDVILHLDQASESSSTRGFDLGVDIAITGIDALATGWINKLLPEPPEAMLALVEKWSTPGTLLKAKLEAALTERMGEALQPLIPILLGDATAEVVAQQQVDRLFQAWEEALNTRIAVIGTSAQSVVDQLLGTASESLGEHYALVQPALTGLAGDLVERVLELQNELQIDLDEAVARIKVQTGQTLINTLKPLEQVGERVNQLVKTLDTSAAPLADAVKRLLARYASLRKALLDGAKQAAKLKLSIAFNSTLEKTRGEGRTLSVRFRRPSDGAKRWFSELMLGRVDIDIDAIQSAAAASDGAFAVEDAGFVAFASRARSTSLTLDIFGMPFGDVRMLSSEVRVEVDMSGRISLLHLAAKQSDQSKTFKESRAARFSADFDVLNQASNALPGVFSLGFELDDNRLKPKELAQFFAGFSDAGVLTAEVAGRARQLLGGKQVKNVQLSVAIAGLSRGLQAAAGERVEDLRREAWQNCIRFMQRGDYVGKNIRENPAVFFDKVLASRTVLVATDLAKKVLPEIGGSTSSTRTNALGREMHVLYLAINAIPNAVAALAKIGALAAQLQTENVSDQRARDARDLLDTYLDEANRALSPVINVGDGIFALFSERLPDIAVALLAILARLAGPEGLAAKPALRYFSVNDKGQRQFGPPILIS